MKESGRDWIRKCASCEARKRPRKRRRALLSAYAVGTPMDRVAIDLLGPFPVTDRNNIYILVVQDQFTKWTEAYSITDFSAETVTHKLNCV